MVGEGGYWWEDEEEAAGSKGTLRAARAAHRAPHTTGAVGCCTRLGAGRAHRVQRLGSSGQPLWAGNRALHPGTRRGRARRPAGLCPRPRLVVVGARGGVCARVPACARTGRARQGGGIRFRPCARRLGPGRAGSVRIGPGRTGPDRAGRPPLPLHVTNLLRESGRESGREGEGEGESGACNGGGRRGECRRAPLPRIYPVRRAAADDSGADTSLRRGACG